MPKPVPVTVTATAKVPPQRCFDAIIPIDLTAMMQGYGPLPAVSGVRDQVGPWDTPGSTRVVELADGNETPERIVAVAQPEAFHYRVGPFTGPLGRLVAHVDGSFLFDATADGGTVVSWTYAFRPRRGGSLPVRGLAPLWRRYATQSLQRAVAIAEA
ncbi:SRPBCC family protein [Patulibacter minatonensis]|uniref:SRPBCC family protein n=1 Tax=Patulibacter minatonensis TaxID=298163 RepID=UPI0004B06667|nr:SRPBCC family protein [Patulibacter minatonensis]